MNSDGEKMPPDEPAPRLATSPTACRRRGAEQPRRRAPAVEDRLDRRIADALDKIMPERLVQRVDQAPTSSMPKMPRVAAGHLLEQILGRCRVRMKSAAATPHSAPSST
jgi:hypothetical protein